jgi:hypothetical protein
MPALTNQDYPNLCRSAHADCIFVRNDTSAGGGSINVDNKVGCARTFHGSHKIGS